MENSQTLNRLKYLLIIQRGGRWVEYMKHNVLVAGTVYCLSNSPSVFSFAIRTPVSCGIR